MQPSRLRTRQPSDRPEATGASALAGLFLPLPHLLASGGDPRLEIDPATGTNQYGCAASPEPDVVSFASSTASTISPRAYDHLARAREALMRRALDVGFEEAFDARLEALRGELGACLGLEPGLAEIVLSPSGTDSQLHALFAARTLLGSALTTIVVGADQTGSGTAHTALGRHFSARAASGHGVRKGSPIAGLADGVVSVGVPLLDSAGMPRAPQDVDCEVLEAVAAAVADGRKVLLQVMDASKFGWRAPGSGCLAEIAALWPHDVQVVVDACQLRLGRARLARHLARGHIVIVTGSKFFTGPGFSGALLVPARRAARLDFAATVPEEFRLYAGRSDWPRRFRAIRAQLPQRFNFGQWLRWEAALEEIRGYYAVPDAFRAAALAAFARAVADRLAASPALAPLPAPPDPRDDDDEEFCTPTIFPFLLCPERRPLPAEVCAQVYRALAAQGCLIGQPVTVGTADGPAAALRICAGARLVREAWDVDPGRAARNLDDVAAQARGVVDKLEWLLADAARFRAGEMPT